MWRGSLAVYPFPLHSVVVVVRKNLSHFDALTARVTFGCSMAHIGASKLQKLPKLPSFQLQMIKNTPSSTLDTNFFFKKITVAFQPKTWRSKKQRGIRKRHPQLGHPEPSHRVGFLGTGEGDEASVRRLLLGPLGLSFKKHGLEMVNSPNKGFGVVNFQNKTKARGVQAPQWLRVLSWAWALLPLQAIRDQGTPVVLGSLLATSDIFRKHLLEVLVLPSGFSGKSQKINQRGQTGSNPKRLQYLEILRSYSFPKR